MADEPMEPLLSNQIWDGSVLLSLRRERGYRIKGLGTASIEQGVHTLVSAFHQWIHHLVCTIVNEATDSDLTRCNTLDIIELRCLISIASKVRGQRISEDALSHCNMRLADRKDFRPEFSEVRKSGAYFNVTSATWKCTWSNPCSI
jgi:hypothetical protein